MAEAHTGRRDLRDEQPFLVVFIALREKLQGQTFCSAVKSPLELSLRTSEAQSTLFESLLL